MKKANVNAFAFIAGIGLMTALTPLSSNAQIIVSDNFNIDYEHIGGQAPTLAQVDGDLWNAGGTGVGGVAVVGGVLEIGGPNRTTNYSVLHLPFDASGITDTISLSVDFAHKPEGGTFYFGFGTDADAYVDNKVGLGFFGDWTDHGGTSATMRMADGYDNHPQDAGIGTFGMTRATGADQYEATLRIDYNPTTDLATFYSDGQQVGSGTYDGPIGGFTVKVDWGLPQPVVLDNLTISVVPEPATIVFFAGLGALMLVIYKRKRGV